MEFFDIHAHIFPPHVAEKVIAQLEGYYGFKWEGTGVYEDLIASMDEAGVRRCTIFSCATKPEQVETANTYLASLQEKFPERFCCFGTMHPAYHDIPGELKRLKSMGLKGLKIHPDFQRINIDDPGMIRIYDLVGDTLPRLFHIGDPYQDYSAPKRLGRVLDMMPHLKVIAAHLGDTVPGLKERNIWLAEISGWILQVPSVICRLKRQKRSSLPTAATRFSGEVIIPQEGTIKLSRISNFWGLLLNRKRCSFTVMRKSCFFQ